MFLQWAALRQRLADLHLLVPDHPVPAGPHRLLSLGHREQGQAGGLEELGLFLYIPKVGQDQAGVLLQDQQVQVAVWGGKAQVAGDVDVVGAVDGGDDFHVFNRIYMIFMIFMI
jgi:hypothetical protein